VSGQPGTAAVAEPYDAPPVQRAAPGSREDEAARAQGASENSVRGSTLLVVGRVFALGVQLAIQVLIVRHLSKADYGSFAYALSIVIFGQTVVVFGLDRAVSRFLPIYDERQEYGAILGTLALVIGVITSLGIVLIAIVALGQNLLAQSVISDEQAVSLLLILIVLSPIQALDELVTSLFAIYARPRAIFFRKYLLSPGLKFLVVLLLVLSGSGVTFLAAGYVAAAVLGVAVYGGLVVKTLRTSGLWARFSEASIELRARELFMFTIPLLSTDLLYAVIGLTDAVLLSHFRGPEAVASLRSVQPAAQLNQIVFYTFLLLFTPMAARMFARRDHEGLKDLYWHTTGWIMVMSCPIFLFTFSLAEPAAVTLFGSRYADAGVLLAVLSLGYYFQVAFGFNGTTLMVFGRLRFIVGLNVLAVVANIAANFVLIPPYGALGAAIGTAVTLVVHNLLKQAALRIVTGIPFFSWRYASLHLSIAAAAAGLLLAGLVIHSEVLRFALAAVVSLAVVAANRRLLRVDQTFPELQRLPFVRLLVGRATVRG
jgi:O-antigen/teichoic acid export membrane protein